MRMITALYQKCMYTVWLPFVIGECMNDRAMYSGVLHVLSYVKYGSTRDTPTNGLETHATAWIHA